MKRNIKIDALKGFGLCLMVMGHSGFPFTSWIYLFHMPIFFVASGMLWNNQNAKDNQIRTYIIRKAHKLWLPYVVINTIFLLLNNLFLDFGLYTSDPGFLEYAQQTDTLSERISLDSFFINFVKIILMSSGTQLGGALWFLRCLLVINIGHCIVYYLVQNTKNKNAILLVVFGITAVCMELASRQYLLFLRGFSNEFAAYVAFLLGTQTRKLMTWCDDYFAVRHYLVTIAVSALILTLLNGIGRVSLVDSYITNTPFYISALFFGWLFTYSAISVISRSPQYYLSKISSRSIFIIGFHFLSFKLITYMYLILTKGDMLQLACFPTLHQGSSFLWIIYSVIGIMIPCNLNYIFERIKNATTLIKKQNS